MKRFGWILALLLMTTPAWSAKKISVAELKQMLMSMHQANKSDEDVAAALKQVQMGEELDRNTMNSMAEFVPGQLSTEQIYVLEARSAMLPPPASSIPATPAPDATAQKAILDKAEAYITKTFAQLPALTASKTTRRFQDNAEVAAPSNFATLGSSSVVPQYQFVRFINSASTDVTIDHGVAVPPAEKDKTPWGANRMIAIPEPDPRLGEIFAEAQGLGSIKWLRWETLNGKQTAVFSFDVPKKKSHYALNVCCFPDVDQLAASRMSQGALPQNGTSWHNYKAVVPYRGEFYIDPESGTVLRMITEPQLKHSEMVRQVDTRIDYEAVTVGDKSLVVPVKTVINTEVVPTGDAGQGFEPTRVTLFTADYTNYKLAGGAK